MRPYHLLAGPLLLLLACSSASSTSGGGPTTIKASDYNQTCQSNADCVLVNDGDLCGCLACGSAAINHSAQAQFQADADQRKKSCSGPPTACPAIACAYAVAVCNAGICGICRTPGCANADGGTSDAAPEAGAD
jgi:hypothetical protein